MAEPSPTYRQRRKGNNIEVLLEVFELLRDRKAV